MPRFRPTISHDPDDFEAELEAISGDDLRAVVRDMAEWFDDAMYARFTSALVARAARTTAGWTPEAIRSRYRRYPALQRELGAAERSGRGRSRGRA